jgi:glucokinase-like ROK family protein
MHLADKKRTGDPEIAREINKALILGTLRKQDRVSRAEIARALDLSKVTVSTIVNELIERRFVAEQGMGESRQSGGRKPILLSLDCRHVSVIGVDIGTTSTVVAVGDLKGGTLHGHREPTARNHSLKAVSAQVSRLVARAVAEAGTPRKRVIAVGVSVAGIVDTAKGFIRFSPDLAWENVPLRDILERETGLRVIVDNCTRVMALGEKWYGGVHGARNVLYVNVGYGIGSALIINNQIYDNHSEFGHIPVTRRRVLCHCGKYGCLEAVASGSAIESQGRGVNASAGAQASLSARELAERARGGDEEAGRIFAGAGRYLGRAISIATNLFNPDKVIIGGGVALADDLLLRPLRAEFEAQTMEVFREHARIELSTLGMDAAVRGAIALALNACVFNSGLVDSMSS